MPDDSTSTVHRQVASAIVDAISKSTSHDAEIVDMESTVEKTLIRTFTKSSQRTVGFPPRFELWLCVHLELISFEIRLAKAVSNIEVGRHWQNLMDIEEAVEVPEGFNEVHSELRAASESLSEAFQLVDDAQDAFMARLDTLLPSPICFTEPSTPTFTQKVKAVLLAFGFQGLPDDMDW